MTPKELREQSNLTFVVICISWFLLGLYFGRLLTLALH